MEKLLFTSIITSLTFATFLLINPPKVEAAGSLYLAPAGKSVAYGTNLSIAVRVNTGQEPVNAVQANLLYPADKLDFLGISTSGTAFEIQAEGSGGGGSVRIARGSVSAKTGDHLVATITFRIKSSNGTATVSFAAGSAVVRATDNGDILAAKSGGTYNFAPPSVQPPTDATAVQISEIRVEDVGLNSTAISWKTNKLATSLVEYGPSEKLGITASDTSLKTDHKLTLESKLLFPGTTYFYQVKSKDDVGNEGTSQIGKFKTKGFKVIIKVQSSTNRPLKEIKVVLFSERLETATGKDGLAQFDDVASGKHALYVAIGSKKLAFEIEVKETTEVDKPQEYTVTVPTSLILAEKLTVFAIGLFVLLLVLGIVLAWRHKFGQKPPGKPGFHPLEI